MSSFKEVNTVITEITTLSRTTWQKDKSPLSEILINNVRDSLTKNLVGQTLNKVLHDITPHINHMMFKEFEHEYGIIDNATDFQNEYHTLTKSICFLIKATYEQYTEASLQKVNIAEVIDHLQILFKEKEYRIQSIVDPSLFGHANLGALTSTLANMLQNSRDRGKATLVTIHIEQHVRGISIIVKDNGKGIILPEGKSIEDIFKEGTSGGHSSGFGLVNNEKLGIVDLYAEEHGGLQNTSGSHGALLGFTIAEYSNLQNNISL